MVNDQLIWRGISDQRILDAFRKITRHTFVLPTYLSSSYEDHPLPIGYSQTISQPYIVAYMLEELLLKGDEKVLEIGTGSGYQTALLAELTKSVYTVDRIPELIESARPRLQKLGYKNIFFKVSDGTVGWRESAPFDRIIVSAGAPGIPQSLIDQLADKGMMIIPVGNELSQNLVRIKKDGSKPKTEILTACVFVKLIGKEGWKL